MLSYQHLYHAGNLADVHKHALLAWTLDYLTAKDKPLTYLESHAGRGLYDLSAPEAVKTGEAAQGIGRLVERIAPDHPYARVLARVRAAHGPSAYAGSALIAAMLLRDTDSVHLAERHPREHAALVQAMLPFAVRVHQADGFAKMQELTPPTPRRGLLLIDPSFETAADYEGMPRFIGQVARKWNVGVIALWYPILTDARHDAMLAALDAAHPGALRHEVRFPPARPGHRMVGSGLFVVNPPWGLADEAARLEALFA
ncbi:MAG: 23S rRNA (adenine(2030)-N(6))-methyltransferase RlmJ [Rhodobacter sp.]|uniref:23S rRNA (adenine(2030)-N(6))-methyltransferase RlmJ n=1 Tax=Pararhodobacter sp. TaxID=2127056 RepID=UPI001D26A24C|nr:23S rRNA (adenine(2030)-N(6))-methyltransferase RlmJ [Pararhodobacter sp.]MCB1345887.1 23S rRNA (adenine(2030)-N(6))-methyltransferase RlmJ [Paracoccaceae bacterium]MCC0073655.1 23S rRNA (adenine(2030)-N(6))-methyltransferase RlmJ [Rhodobacter sp.]HPD93769.1 23S rRNA (adenine(2030)-N(6))-methyltransferase RlmJ [Pararhodobacter sp.]